MYVIQNMQRDRIHSLLHKKCVAFTLGKVNLTYLILINFYYLTGWNIYSIDTFDITRSI